MNLSILMTSVSTIVGIGAIPFMIKFISGFFLDECSTIEDATVNIIVSLLITLAPCGLGMLIRAKASQKICDFILKLGQVNYTKRLNQSEHCLRTLKFTGVSSNMIFLLSPCSLLS